jgi:hypothetical protein
MPPCKDWTEVNFHDLIMRVVAMTSGRIFVGTELCRSPQYIDAAINYTLELMAARGAVRSLPPWRRPFSAPRLPEVKRLHTRMAEAHAILQPVVDHRRAACKDPTYEKPDDMLQWLIDGHDKFTDKNSQDLAMVQLVLSFAAIHTTTLTAMNA